MSIERQTEMERLGMERQKREKEIRKYDREIDREGETGYGEIEEREKEIRKYDIERERERAYKNG